METNSPKININITEDLVRVGGLTILKEGNVKAIINVWIGPIKISGFKIIAKKESKEGENPLFIAPPSYRSSKDFCDSFFTPDQYLWSLIKERMFKRYYELLEKEKPESQKNTKDSEIPVIEENPDFLKDQPF